MPTSLTDKGGHEWTLEGYTRTVITSTTHRVFNEARAQSMKEFDTVLATMSSHPAARPACAPIQGKVVCIVPKSDPKADLSYPNIYDYGYGKQQALKGLTAVIFSILISRVYLITFKSIMTLSKPSRMLRYNNSKDTMNAVLDTLNTKKNLLRGMKILKMLES